MDKITNEQGDIVAQAKAYLKHVEAGDEQKADEALDSLTRIHESGLFSELGKLTRELHNSINSFHLDVRLTDIAEQEIPDAKERLNYVIDMTDKSAHKVLNAAEESLPMADDVCQTAIKLQEIWHRFMNKDMDVKEFRQVANSLKDFFVTVENNSKTIKQNLSDIIMAQDFQDLTGQIIRRVINLVQDVEENLVNLIRISGVPSARAEPLKKNTAIEATGPAVPNVDVGTETVNGQDEVDDLLSSLGF